MNATNSILCTGCSKPFSSTNLPRVAECSHTYCQKCLLTLEQCTLDKQSHTPGTDLNCFPVNTTILKMIGVHPPHHNSKEFCLLHDKEIDLVCIDDGVGICTNCALFGQHRSHNIKTVGSVISECTSMAEQTIHILTELQELQNTTSLKFLEGKIDGMFKQKKEILGKQIRGRFFKIMDSVRNTEKMCLAHLDDILDEEKKIMKQGIKGGFQHERKQSWIKEAEHLVQTVDNVKIDEATRYLNVHCRESGIIKKGEYLVMELNTMQMNVTRKLESKLNEIAFQMDTSNFERSLEGCYSLKRAVLQLEVPKTDKHDDEFLLEQEDYPVTPFAIQKQKPIERVSSDTHVQIPQLIMEKVGINVHSFVLRSQRKADRSMIKQPLGVSNLDNRRKRKIKIPEKYEGMFDDLRNDKVDCIDFTNAELGDATIIQLTEYIRNASKLRTVKLIRNKLTDQCLLPLLEACIQAQVLSLNLGQNSMTDKALDILEKLNPRELKNLTLSQNKLNQRSCKGKILEFKKKGLTISI